MHIWPCGTARVLHEFSIASSVHIFTCSCRQARLWPPRNCWPGRWQAPVRSGGCCVGATCRCRLWRVSPWWRREPHLRRPTRKHLLQCERRDNVRRLWRHALPAHHSRLRGPKSRYRRECAWCQALWLLVGRGWLERKVCTSIRSHNCKECLITKERCQKQTWDLIKLSHIMTRYSSAISFFV